MAWFLYLAPLLLVVTVMSQREGNGGDLLKQFCLTKEEQDKVDLQAEQQLQNELTEERNFASFDKRVAGPRSHIEQHRRFTFTAQKSVERGINHRLNVINVKKALEIKAVPHDLTKPLLTAGFGPKVFCDDNCTCDINTPYRTADGSCNNLQNTHWGQASIPMRRWLEPIYQDGVSSPRQLSVTGTYLPSARTVSLEVHQLSDDPDLSNNFTHMLMQWGQFLDHDITSTPSQQGGYTGGSIGCCAVLFRDFRIDQSRLDNRPECFPIKIPEGDRYFEDCMNFVRSVQVENAKCHPAPVEQLNQITAYIDASQVYGSSQEEQNSLRKFVDGLMKVKTASGKDYLPEDNAFPASCNTFTAPNHCFKAGDKRVNENPGLQSIHTLFLWEHNRIAKELKALNCHWSDEKIFQEARKIVGAIMQDITYGEYLPILLGEEKMEAEKMNILSSGYSSLYSQSTDASIRNAFATAAFRVGHSMIRSFFSSFNQVYTSLGSDQLRNIFGNTHKIITEANRDVDSYHRGLVEDKMQKVDGKLTPEVTRHLFRDGANAFDLAALNIQRGRDHGLDTYMKFRKYCGKAYVTSFTDLSDTHDASTITLLSNAYGSPEDIDLFTGGLTERPLPDGLVGPTFSCLLAKQFKVLKEGDRFWFEEGNDVVKFTPGQLTELRKASLSRVICDNTNTITIQANAFKQDPKLSCTDIPKIDLRKWKETLKKWSPWGMWGRCDRGGIQRRTRRCLPFNCGCVGVNTESRRCALIEEPVFCTFSSWGPWGNCFNNVRSRSRRCYGSQTSRCFSIPSGSGSVDLNELYLPELEAGNFEEAPDDNMLLIPDTGRE